MTRSIVDSFSKEKEKLWHAGMVTLQIKADIEETLKKISKFHESRNLTDAVLIKAEWELSLIHI